MGLTTRPTHWFKDLEAQRKGRPCEYHPFSPACSAAPEPIDFALLGTPCHPYSTQRSGRWNESSVESHHEFDVAMKSFVNWLKDLHPKSLVFEQVLGFVKPIHAGSSETPYTRFFEMIQQTAVSTYFASLLVLL